MKPSIQYDPQPPHRIAVLDRIIRSHYWIVVLQLLACALLFFVPDLIGIGLTKRYTPFAAAPGVSAVTLDESVYAISVRRFVETGSARGDLDVYELRHARTGLSNGYAYVLGLAGKVIGVEATWILAHALLPALAWGLIAWIALRFITSLAAASAIAWITCLVSFGPRNLFFLGTGSMLQRLELSRIPNPLLSFPLLLLAIVWQARALNSGGGRRIFAAAVLSAALAYAYYFYGVAIAGVVTLSTVLLWLRRREHAGRAAAIALLTFAGMLPYALSMLAGRDTLRFQLARWGTFTHAPSVAGLVILTLGLGLAWYVLRARRHDHDSLLFLLLCLVAAAGAGMNLQVITGYDAQHAHFMNRLLQPLLLGLGLGWIAHRFRAWAWTRRALTGAALVVVLLAGVRQVLVGRNTARFHERTRESYALLDWIHDQLGSGHVIGTRDAELIALIPTVTGNWNYVPHPKRTLVSDQETAARYRNQLRIEGVTLAEAERAVGPRPAGVSNDFVSEADLIEQARTHPQAPNGNWRLDYVIVKSPQQLPGWRLLHATEHFAVHSVRQSNKTIQ